MLWIEEIHKLLFAGKQMTYLVVKTSGENVHDRDRRELFDDVVHMLAKKEKVGLILLPENQ